MAPPPLAPNELAELGMKLRDGERSLATERQRVGRVLRIARTVADLDESVVVSEEHLLEALGLPRPDREG